MYVLPTIEEFLEVNKHRLKYIGNKSGCIIWTGTKDHRGWPRYTWYEGKKRHTMCMKKFVHFLHTRRVLRQGESVSYICESDLCVNPWHLEIAKRSRVLGMAETERVRNHDIELAHKENAARLNPHRKLHKFTR